MMKEYVIKRRDDAGGHYKGEGWCMRTLQKWGMQEDVINGRNDAGGMYKREGWCTRTV